ncbi:MAG: PTS sugar transporter subunit IIB [Deltaproteobacteria bacterium]|nr:PTS sugar transporter subunit IIB [Deltaproteobacteria bacterium]
MILLVRVDDRLLHGQVLCAWVPHTGADLLVVVSDEAREDTLRTAVMDACGEDGLKVIVRGIKEVLRENEQGDFKDFRGMLVVNDLRDALMLYEGGLRFASLNIGNVHHNDGGRKVSRSVILSRGDEEIIERLFSLGVEIDIRDMPAASPVPYEKSSSI